MQKQARLMVTDYIRASMPPHRFADYVACQFMKLLSGAPMVKVIEVEEERDLASGKTLFVVIFKEI